MGAATELPTEVQDKIRQAREVQGRPHGQRFTEPTTVAAALHQHALAYGTKPFLIYYDDQNHRRERSWIDFYVRVRITAKLLRDTFELRRGDRIITAMHNHDHAILLTFAAWHLGLTVVPLNMGEDDKRLGYILEHCGAKALFVLKEYAERMRTLLASLSTTIRHAVQVGDNYASGLYLSFEREVSLVKLDHEELHQPPADAQADGAALIVYTSGTTGVPKGVVLSQYNLIADAYAISRWHDLTPDKRMMCVLPIHHVNGLVVTHVTPVYYGGSVVLNRKFHTAAFFERIRRENVHVVSVVPTLLQFLTDGVSKDVDHKYVPSLSHLICGAGPLTVDLAARFEDRFGVQVCHGYGLSETTCYASFLPIPSRTKAAAHNSWMRDHGFPSIGCAVETNDMAIHDDLGQPVPEGQKGEIVIRGHNVMLGYANDVKANAGAFTHAWFRSGDEGFWKQGPDGKAYYFISGRLKELIIRGAVKISPLEIDEVINRMPALQAGMAVGFEHRTYGEEVGAYCVKKPGVDVSAQQVLDFCRQHLAAHAAPKVVVFGETFPVTSTGKYQRNQLKTLFTQWKDAQFK